MNNIFGYYKCNMLFYLFGKTAVEWNFHNKRSSMIVTPQYHKLIEYRFTFSGLCVTNMASGASSLTLAFRRSLCFDTVWTSLFQNHCVTVVCPSPRSGTSGPWSVSTSCRHQEAVSTPSPLPTTTSCVVPTRTSST